MTIWVDAQQTAASTRPLHLRIGRALAEAAKEHPAVIVSAALGFLLFSGQGYYHRLFEAFGVFPGAVNLSQVDITTMGLNSTLWALWNLIRDNALRIILYASGGTAVGAILAMLVGYWAPMRRVLE